MIFQAPETKHAGFLINMQSLKQTSGLALHGAVDETGKLRIQTVNCECISYQELQYG